MVVARVVEFTGDRPGKQVWTWCPGCDHMHPFTIEAPPGKDGEQLNSGTTWEWDGDLESPTFSPSLLCYSSVHRCAGQHPWEVCEDPEACTEKFHTIYHKVDGEIVDWKFWKIPKGSEEVRVHEGPHPLADAWGNCHSFLRAGVWQFLGDSAHALAGQYVPMVELPSWYDGSED